MALLIIDVAMLLDQSKVGAAAAKALEKAWAEAQGQSDEKKRALYAELDQKRAALRVKLLERARPAIAELAKKKGAEAVVEKSVVVWAAAEDITRDVIAKVDAAGPLAP